MIDSWTNKLMNNYTANTSASQQALWFLLVGACAALVHFLILVSIVSYTTITPTWANVCAFLIAFVVSFLGHFHLTFKQSNRSNKSSQNNREINKHLSALGKWFSSSVIGFLANQSLFVLGLNWFGERYYILIWLLVTSIITVMTFVLGKFWAFKS